MKREVGWIAGSAVAFAAVAGTASLQPRSTQDPSSQQRPAAAASRSTQQSAQATNPLYQGPCHDMADQLRQFLSLPETARFGPAACGPFEAASTVSVAAPTESKPVMHFVLATLPDPAHTNLPLSFDRNIQTIQLAAHAQGYDYDSSWLPWDAPQPDPPLLSDKDQLDNRRQAREAQPGVLLFRKSLRDPHPPNEELTAKSKKHFFPLDPYRDVLIIFVIAEDATAGIHREQFENAVGWTKHLESFDRKGYSEIQILGPTFSGSLTSLSELLHKDEITTALTPHGADRLRIYSGNVTSNLGANWFTDPDNLPSSLNVLFHSFQQDDKTVTKRYIAFLVASGIAACHLAIVSEDETAYGAEHTRSKELGIEPGDNDCTSNNHSSNDTQSDIAGPTQFFYARDISAVRTAYQEQSLFNRSTNQTSSDSSRKTLREDISGSDQDNDDSIKSYGGSQTALTEEATLLQIVSMMRAHRSQFILLRSSNSLDQLFLAKFFKLSYPEGRVVILGNDLLLRRDIVADGLSGVTTVSTWPLIPEIDHWTGKFHEGDEDQGNGHLHIAFPESSAQGTFVALSFLLTPPISGDCDRQQQYKTFLPKNCNYVDVPDYRYPFWLKPHPYPTPTTAPFDDPEAQVPVTWLSVLGQDGFWPVASLDDGPLAAPHFNLFSAIGTVWSASTHSLRAVFTPQTSPNWRDLPLSINVCLFAVLLWGLFHLACSGAPSITVKPTHRSSFVRLRKLHITSDKIIHPRSHRLLIVFSSSLLSIVSVLIAWGYGWMWTDGPISNHPRLYAAFPIAVWFMGFFAVLANIWVEHLYRDQDETKRKSKTLTGWSAAVFPKRKRFVRSVLWRARFPLLYYTAATAAFYCFLLLYIDNSLVPQVRVPAYLRAVNLTTGASPVVPLVLLALGLYGWCWSSLKGMSLFGEDRPVLPKPADLEIELPADKPDESQAYNFFTMLDEDNAASPIEQLCWPFDRRIWAVAAGVFALLFLGSWIIVGDVPLRSLGTSRYGLTLCIWIAIVISIMLANAWQLTHLWLRLREILVFIDKIPLRRTIMAMRGFSWSSIWKLGGNVLDIRYKIFYRQLEALNHLQANLRKAMPDLTGDELAAAQQCDAAIQLSIGPRYTFSQWFANHWDDWTARDLTALKDVQENFAHITGLVLTKVLVPAWRHEDRSLLILPDADGDSADLEGRLMRKIVAETPAHIRSAEEVACLLYIGFVQNVLGRMRSLVTGISCLFLSIAFVLPSYPFDPRPLLTGSVITLFLIAGLIIFAVYSQMFRDTTLSHLTNTKPGELGTEFWFKFIGFGVGPVFGLLASVLPNFGSFLSSWLQPGLSSIK